MSFSILFDLIKEYYDYENSLELTEVYNKFYTAEGNRIINIPYAMKNWCDEVCDLYDIPDNYFRKAWIKDILCDYDQINKLLTLVQEYKLELDKSQ